MTHLFTVDDFRVQKGDEVELRKWPTVVRPVYNSTEHYQELLAQHIARLSILQQLLYASKRFAVLLIFQGTDSAGKDGAIQHVMSGVNPQGCQVFSFEQPSATELRHRLSLGHDLRSAGTRADRHLQPFLLRGGADRPRPSGESPPRRTPRGGFR